MGWVCLYPSFFAPPKGRFQMKKLSVRQLCLCAVVAALYAAVTILTAPLSYGLVQFRLSEALVVLCAFEPILAVGITVGCFLANLFSTVTALDIVVGTLATALACLWTIHCKKAWLVPLPNVLLNAVIVGGMLAWILFPDNLTVGFLTAALQVGFGELVVMYVLGLPLYLFEEKHGLLRRMMG